MGGRAATVLLAAARLDEVRWSEMCFCDPPLAHERATVLDHYFDGINPEPIEHYERYVGEPFVEYLQKRQEDNSTIQIRCHPFITMVV